MPSNKIILRKWFLEDAEGLARIANDPDVAFNMSDGFPKLYTIENAKAFINNAIKSSNVLLAVVLQEAIVGSIGGFFDENESEKVTIGYFIGRDYWRKGYGSIAIKKTIELLQRDHGIKHIVAEPFRRNIGSHKVLEKNGFQLKEELENGNVKDGKPIATCRYEYLIKF